MTAREAARQYAASLVEEQLAGRRTPECGKLRVDSTFIRAPLDVRRAIWRGLSSEDVADEMARLAEELRADA